MTTVLSAHIVVADDPAPALDELRTLREQAPHHAEITAQRGSAILHALLNEQRCFLLFMREAGDPGFSLAAPDAFAEGDETAQFNLANGQVDSHPVSSTYPVERAFPALEMFLTAGCVPDDLVWRNDAGDAQPQPNDTAETTPG